MLQEIKAQLAPSNCQLVAVSKTKPVEMIQALYDQGQRHFGENRVQELVDKQAVLPNDIKWHFIGHLQSNKVKYIAPFVYMIHAIDSRKLLNEVNKKAKEHHRTIDVLLQFKIADEASKHGYTANDALKLLADSEWRKLSNLQIRGVMGMATFTDNKKQIKEEFALLRNHFDRLKSSVFMEVKYFNELSMGMSGDYKLALEHGSTIVRIGSLLFGHRG